MINNTKINFNASVLQKQILGQICSIMKPYIIEYEYYHIVLHKGNSRYKLMCVKQNTHALEALCAVSCSGFPWQQTQQRSRDGLHTHITGDLEDEGKLISPHSHTNKH